LRLHSPGGAPVTESAYWKLESLLNSTNRARVRDGANGGIYAVRKLLFPPLPAGTVVDDFVAALRCSLGVEVRYEPERSGTRRRPDHTGEYRARPDRGRLLQGAVAPS